VVLDRNLRAISNEIEAFVGEHYAPVGKEEPLRARLFDAGRGRWSDEGRRLPAGAPLTSEPHLYVGEGWHDYEVEGNIGARRSRGARSILTVPVARPADFAVVLRARLEWSGAPVHLRLGVNGRSAGETELRPGWQDYRFSVPLAAWRRGFNEVALSYSATPRRADPGYRGPNAVIALASVELVRTN
jgi:hypothetical protein